MANGCCTNALCSDRENQLRLARLREELLTNFNALLIDRIRFLEQTINQLTSPSTSSSSITHSSVNSSPLTNNTSQATTTDQLSTPPSSLLLRRSSSTSVSFLQNPFDLHLPSNGTAAARSCPSSVDLSSNDDRRTRFFSSTKLTRNQNRTYSDSHSNQLANPIDGKWTTLNTDLTKNSNVNNEKGRLESRRFACDVDDNEVRALKAMIYMEQARKQNARPLTRLRQALGISNHSGAGHFTFNHSKKHSNS